MELVGLFMLYSCGIHSPVRGAYPSNISEVCSVQKPPKSALKQELQYFNSPHD
jgi:hypothetical protein